MTHDSLQPAAPQGFLEVHTPHRWWLIAFEVSLTWFVVQCFNDGSYMLAIAGGCALVVLIFATVNDRGSVVVTDQDVEVFQHDEGKVMLLAEIVEVEVWGRKIRLVGDSQTLSFRVPRADVSRVVAEIEMRRAQVGLLQAK